MKSWKFKILFPIIVLTGLVIAKYIMWDYPTSSGKRVGNLTKFSKKGKLLPTWEGTIDEGSGDKLTSYFSVSNEELAQELYNYEGKEVVIYYDQYIMGWPRDTNYDITSWKPKDANSMNGGVSGGSNPALNLLSKTLFCSLLGAIYSDAELYQRVKDHVQGSNLYLYNQIENCNQ